MEWGVGKGEVSLVFRYEGFEPPWDSYVLLSGHKRKLGLLPSGGDGYTWSAAFAAEEWRINRWIR